MGATSFERMRRANAAREIIGLLEGRDLEEFRLQFGLQCEATPVSVEEALTGRTDYLELKERVQLWIGDQGTSPEPPPEPEPPDEPEAEPEAQPPKPEPEPEPELPAAATAGASDEAAPAKATSVTLTENAPRPRGRGKAKRR